MILNYSNPRVNSLLIKLLPTSIKWITKEELSAQTKNISKSYKECLIATEKHGNDIQIHFGYLRPTNNYEDFQIYAKCNGLSKEYPDHIIDINKIIGIGFIEQYICR